jgi:hypothetical protein
MANEAAASMRTIVGPQINKACLAKANECKAIGIGVTEDCKPLVDCRTIRDGFYRAVESVHLAVLAFRVAEAAGRPTGDLTSILLSARRALDEAWRLAIMAGYVEFEGSGDIIGPTTK